MRTAGEAVARVDFGTAGPHYCLPELPEMQPGWIPFCSQRTVPSTGLVTNPLQPLLNAKYLLCAPHTHTTSASASYIAIDHPFRQRRSHVQDLPVRLRWLQFIRGPSKRVVGVHDVVVDHVTRQQLYDARRPSTHDHPSLHHSRSLRRDPDRRRRRRSVRFIEISGRRRSSPATGHVDGRNTSSSPAH